MKNLDLDHDVHPVGRVLGIHWCFQFDMLFGHGAKKDLTRRGILSIINCI